MVPRLKTLKTLCVFGFLFVGFACSGNPPEEPENADEQVEESDVKVEPAYDASPLEAYLNLDGQSVPESEFQWFEALQDQLEDCMAQVGFEYQPIDLRESSGPGGQQSQELYGDLIFGTDDWIAEYGLGITTIYSMDQSIPSTSSDEGSIVIEGEAYDPEFDEEYQLALYGGNPEEVGGCTESALLVVGDPEPREDAANGQVVDNLFRDLDERIATDTRLVEDRERGRRCLVEASSEFLSEDELFNSLFDSAAEISDSLDLWRSLEANVQRRSNVADDGSTELIIESRVIEVDPDTGEESLLGLRDAEQLYGDSIQLEARIDAVHELEVSSTLQFIECEVSLPPIYLSEMYIDVRDELELAFIDENRALLDAIALSD